MAMYAPEPLLNNQLQYDCLHEAELIEYQRMMEFASYDSACLCLCMTSYQNIPEPSDSAAYRDTLAIRGLNLLGYFATTLNLGHAESVNPGMHCYANLNNLDRLIPNMKAHWKSYYPQNKHIILDNTRMPRGYVRSTLKDNFYKEVLPYFLDANTRLLAPGGRIWLPNIPDIADNLAHIEQFIDGPILYVQDPFENPLIQARELVKDQLRLATTDYTNDTQLAVLCAHTSFPFIVLTKKSFDEEGVNSVVARIRQKRNNSRDAEVATPHPSAKKRVRTTTCVSRATSTSSSSSSSSLGATTNTSSSSPQLQNIIDLTQTCDCNEEYTPYVKGDNRPRACSLCIGTPVITGRLSSAGRVGFTP